ncbi:hypothetical protein, conserved [Eimeria maxima]|uniref:Myosin heavy chain n=1 Tax=Eimeria maxima TaxID=5804 RepID=U6MHW1_EIMMA|nr:hypothetical protein, conserved [Eimeria maxima]CDJ61240.1 hypothetical protein, conserved [Eimeria maxima]
MLSLISVPAVPRWLWMLGLLCEHVAAANSAVSSFPGNETESLGFAFITADQLFTEGSLEGEEGSRAFQATPASEDTTGSMSPRSPRVNIVFPRTEGTNPALQGGGVPKADGIQPYGTPPSPAHHNAKEGRRSLRAPLSAAVVFLVVCLGLLASRTFKLRAGRKPLVYPHVQQPQQKPQQQERGGEAGPSRGEQLHELQKLQSLATYLAETVGTDSSLAALQQFRSSVQRASEAQPSIVTDSGSTTEPSESSMKEVLDQSVSALSQLYEAARQHGVSLAQKIQRSNDSFVFSEEELQAMGGYFGSALAALLGFHLESLEFSVDFLVKNAEAAEKELRELGDYKEGQGRHLLATVVADVELIRAAHEAVEMLDEFAGNLKSRTFTVLLSHIQKEQRCIHRECRDLLDEQRVRCKVENQRQLSLSPVDTSALEKLNAVEGELRKAKQMLQVHREKIGELRMKKDILPAAAASQEAKTVGRDLKALLEQAASSLSEIAGTAGAEWAAQDKEVQRVMHSLTSRASQEAATVADIVGSMQKEVQLQKPITPPFAWMRQNRGRESPEANTFINPSVETLLPTWLQQVAENAQAVANQAADAAAEVGRGGIGSTASESLHAASRATMLAEALSQEADLLGLRAQLLASLKFEMQASDILARRAAAAAGATAETEEFQHHWRVSLPPHQIQHVQELLDKIKLAKEETWSVGSLRALATAAAAMISASFELISIVHGNEKQ